MENKQVIMMKEKLEFLGIIKEALKIPIKNPNFIFIFLSSFPLFFFWLFHEINFQHTLIESFKFQNNTPIYDGSIVIINSSSFSLDEVRDWFENIVSQEFIIQSFLSLGVVHLLDLVNTIMTVYTTSVIYTEEDQNPMNLKEILSKPIKKVGFKRPLITSIYALLLSSLTLIGLLSFSINIYVTTMTFIKLVWVLIFISLLTKSIEWNAIWNMGVVISILEEKRGDVALGVSAYLSRGRRKRGFLLMVLFFAWSTGLRLSSLYVGWQKRGFVIEVIIGQVCLDYLGNVMKWVVFTIYFYDCKKRFLEKKFDGAEGRA